MRSAFFLPFLGSALLATPLATLISCGGCNSPAPPDPTSPSVVSHAPDPAASPRTGVTPMTRPMDASSTLPSEATVTPVVALPTDPELLRQHRIALESFQGGDHDFAARLFKALGPKTPNAFVSPTSVRMAFAMAYAGARTETATEMAKALALPTDPKAVAAGAGAALVDFGSRGMAVTPANEPEWQRAKREHERVIVRVVNRLWGQWGHPFEAPFTKTLAESYRANLETLDFHKDPELARERINGWVADQTAKKIVDLLPPHSLTSETRLVLTNAVYFKAAWLDEFVDVFTKPEPFVTDSNKTVSTPMMHAGGHWPYAETPTAQVIALPYANRSMVMVVVLPKAKNGLASLEASLEGSQFAAWKKALTDARVDVAFPKFRAGSTFNLGPTMTKLGMTKAFAQGVADFSGMDGTKEIFLGTAVHKAWIDVNEHGTEAAAATAIAAEGAGMPPPETPKKFVADHPFFFFIHDASTNAILFAGRIGDPTTTD